MVGILIIFIMAKETGSRFLAVDETATSTLIDSMKNENTKRKTGYDVQLHHGSAETLCPLGYLYSSFHSDI
jgi:hypothetical protein